MGRILPYLLLAGAALSSGCALPFGYRLMSPEAALIYQPTVYPGGEWNPKGLKYEEANFVSADGTKLHGWYCPAENPRGVVLFAHGHEGNLTHSRGRVRVMQEELNLSVLIFDYRGYGKSGGVPTERGLLADARAARGWLAEKAGVAEHDIVLIGRSLGGGVMVDLAANDGARGLVLESTFTSLPDVAATQFRYSPVRLLMLGKLDSWAKIGQYKGPLLQAHAEDDTLIPITQAKELFEAANTPKQFIEIPDAGHNWLPMPDYVKKLDRFIASLPPASSASSATLPAGSSDDVR